MPFKLVLAIDPSKKATSNQQSTNNEFQKILPKIPESLPEEDWRVIRDYENYLVSSLGRVWSTKRKIFLKFQTDGGGYQRVILSNAPEKEKNFSVHELVIANFVRRKEPGEIITHINRIHSDNRLSNLKITTASDIRKNGVRTSGRAVLQYSRAGKFIRKFDTAKEAAKAVKLKVTGGICLCCQGKQRLAGGFKWAYESSHKIFILREEEKLIKIGFYKGMDFSNYLISSHGRIKHKNKNVEISQGTRESYPTVDLYYHDDYGKGKTYKCYVHILTALSFTSGDTTEKCFVRHINGDKSDNRYTNLEWMTKQQIMSCSKGISIKVEDQYGKSYEYNSIAAAFRALNIRTCNASVLKLHLNTGKYFRGYKWYSNLPAIKDNNLVKELDNLQIN